MTTVSKQPHRDRIKATLKHLKKASCWGYPNAVLKSHSEKGVIDYKAVRGETKESIRKNTNRQGHTTTNNYNQHQQRKVRGE